MTLDDIAQFKCLTDAEIIGNAKQPGDDFVDTHDTYTWYRAIGIAKEPKCILELGVRYGYSLLALGIGACACHSNKNLFGASLEIVGIDAETDGIQSNRVAREYLRTVFPEADVWIPDYNTCNPGSVNAILGTGLNKFPFDIVHVDGDHSETGIQNELVIAEQQIENDGWILIDDIDTPHIKAAADEFCSKLGITPLLIPTFHGLYLCDMGTRC